jgi:hypothetical protein
MPQRRIGVGISQAQFGVRDGRHRAHVRSSGQSIRVQPVALRHKPEPQLQAAAGRPCSNPPWFRELAAIKGSFHKPLTQIATIGSLPGRYVLRHFVGHPARERRSRTRMA